jgi:hypothetical protein
MGTLHPERDLASKKDFLPFSKPPAPFSLFSNLPVLLSFITNARGSHSCLVCGVIGFNSKRSMNEVCIHCFLIDLQVPILQYIQSPPGKIV